LFIISLLNNIHLFNERGGIELSWIWAGLALYLLGFVCCLFLENVWNKPLVRYFFTPILLLQLLLPSSGKTPITTGNPPGKSVIPIKEGWRAKERRVRRLRPPEKLGRDAGDGISS